MHAALKAEYPPMDAPRDLHYHVILQQDGQEMGRYYVPTRELARDLGRRQRVLQAWDVAVFESACADNCKPVLLPDRPHDPQGHVLATPTFEPMTDPERDLRWSIGPNDEFWAFDFAVVDDAVILHVLIQVRGAPTYEERYLVTPREIARDQAERLLDLMWSWFTDHGTVDADLDLADAEHATERLMEVFDAHLLEASP